MKYFILILLFLISCTPAPGDKQVDVEANSAANISLSSNVNSSIGTIAVGATKSIQITLRNSGNLPASDLTFALTGGGHMLYTGDLYPGVNGDCEEVLEAHTSCVVEVFIFSNEAAAFSETLKLNYKNGIEKASGSISFNGYFGQPANLVADLGAVEFGNVQVSTTKSAVVTISNIGNLPALELAGNAYTAFGEAGSFSFTGGAYPGLAGTCSSQLNPGESCKIEILTSPTTIDFLYSGLVDISFKNPTKFETLTISLGTYGADIKGYIEVAIKNGDFAVFTTALNNSPLASAPSLTYVLKNTGYLATTNMNFKSSGSMNLVVDQNNCPASIDPQESCEIVMKYVPQYSYPLPAGVNFPYSVSDAPVVFEYENSKDVGLQETKPLMTSGSVTGEANLLLYPNSDTLNPFDTDISPITKTDRWADGQFEKIVGTGAVSRTLLLKNGIIGKNVAMTNMTFEMIPNNGYLSVTCITNGNCPTKLNSGVTSTLTLKYQPLGDENTYADPYILKITYSDGVKTKTFNIEVPTRAIPLPYLTLDVNFNASDNAHSISKSVLLNNQTSGSVVIKNDGITAVNVKNTIVRNSGQTGESYFTFDDSDCDRDIVNGSTCTLSFVFQKNGDAREVPFPKEVFLNSFYITNGLSDSSEGYQKFDILYRASTLERGWYDVPTPLSIDFGDVLVSTDDQGALGEVNTYLLTAEIPVSAVHGDVPITNMTFDITGDEASHFELVSVEDSIITPGGEDDLNVSGTNTRIFNIRYTAPKLSDDLGLDGLSTATITMKYYGQNQTVGSTDFEPEVVSVNLSAHPIMLPKYKFISVADREPFGPQLYDPSVGTQLLSDVANASHTIVKIQNRGLVANYSGIHSTLKAVKPETTTIDTHYRIRAVDPGNSCFSHYAVNGLQDLEFSINPMSECEFEIYNYSPDGFGDLEESLRIDWQNAQGAEVELEEFKGVGFKYAKHKFNPNNGGSINFVKFDDIDLGTDTSKNFTITSAESTRFVVPGEITSLNIVSTESGATGCSTALNLPSAWSGYPTVYEPSSFTIISQNCTGVSLHPGESSAPYYFSGYQTSCALSIKFAPKHIKKAEKACVEVKYKRFPSETTATGRAIVLIAGAGKIPKSIFNGWREIYAQGETSEDPASVKIRWNAMQVVDDLGTVVGYNVYRKTLQEGTFSTEPVKTGELADFYNVGCNCYQFDDNTDIPLPDGSINNPLTGNKVFAYKVQAIIDVPNEGQYESPTKSGSVDEVVQLFLPTAYHVLVHRWTANMTACMRYLGKSYVDLDREKYYSCEYNGELSVNGDFDVTEHMVVEKYETGKRTSDNKPVYVPGYYPYLYESLSAAKTYCEGAYYSVSDLNINNQKKQLINRLDYMISSYGTDRNTCIKTGSGFSLTGDERCSSSFGVNDMIGNAWDLVDDFMLPYTTSIWRFDVDTPYDGQDYYFSIQSLDFSSYSGSNYNTFMSFYKYDSSVQCFNPLLNEPRYSLGGICADSKGEFRLDDLYSKQMSDYSSTKTSIIFPKHEAELGSAFTIKRHLMMGGSYNSQDRFGVEPHNRVMYWTNPETEKILMSQHPKGAYQGGAARCVFKFADE